MPLRRQVDLSYPSEPPQHAKKPFLEADERARVANAPYETILYFPLTQFDTDTLRIIMEYLSSEDLIVLVQTGDKLLASLVKTELTSLIYTPNNIEYITPRRKVNSQAPLTTWQWPSLLTPSLPKLTIFRLERFSSYTYIQGKLNALPPTLTEFCAKNVSFQAPTFDDLAFCLPNLVTLQFTVVSATVPDSHTNKHLYDEDWLCPSLQHSPFLSNVVYAYMSGSNERSNALVSSIPSLEKLTIAYFAIQHAQCPPNLHTLELTVAGDKTATIPPSITNLVVRPSLDNDELRQLLPLAPSTLLRLKINGFKVVLDNNLLREFARFTSLRSLFLPRRTMYASSLEVGDLFLLPRSITELTNSFASFYGEWHNLPHNVKFAPAAEYHDWASIDRYAPGVDTERDGHFPKNITRMVLINSVVPGPMVALRHVHFILTVSVFTRNLSKDMLRHLPTTLTCITVNLRNSSDLFWIDVPHDRFPLLKRFEVDVERGVHSNQTIVEWLQHLPGTLESVTLRISGPDQHAGLDLTNVFFPPHLTSLTLVFPDRVLMLPTNLPPSLTNLKMEFFGLTRQESALVIVNWPTSLRYLSVTCHVDKSRDAISLAVEQLESRLDYVMNRKRKLREAKFATMKVGL